jgi:hypothetical protein
MLSSVTATKLKFRKWQWKSTMSTLLQSFPSISVAQRCLFLSPNLKDQVLPRYVLSLAPADPKIRNPVKRSLCLRRLSPSLVQAFTRYASLFVMEQEDLKSPVDPDKFSSAFSKEKFVNWYADYKEFMKATGEPIDHIPSPHDL